MEENMEHDFRFLTWLWKCYIPGLEGGQDAATEAYLLDAKNGTEVVDKFEKEGSNDIATLLQHTLYYEELLVINPKEEYSIVEIGGGWYSYDADIKIDTSVAGWSYCIHTNIVNGCIIGPFVFASYEECDLEQKKRLANTTNTTNTNTNTNTTNTNVSSKKVVYTDGSCLNKTNNSGGWAWAVETSKDKSTIYKSGHVPNTTNQRMELQAAIEALKALEGEVLIMSDSAYLVNCFNQSWWRKWKRNGWKTSTNSDVANQDQWEILIRICEQRPGQITWKHVKAHSGIPLNEFADMLATKASAMMKGC